MISRSDNFPLAPKKYPFFYGWLVLVLGSVGLIMSLPGQTHGVSAFNDHLIEALGLTRFQLSMAYMFGTIGSSLLLTWAGRMYDKHGARVVAPVASALLGSILILLHRCDTVSAWISEIIGLEGSVVVPFTVVMFGFFVLRFSGQGVLTMVSRNMIMKWFDRYRGLVIGVIGMVFAPIFSAAPMIFNKLVVGFGWRNAWLLLALASGAIFTIVASLFYRDNPEDCGLVPDGPLADRPVKPNQKSNEARKQYTLAEARRDPSFWVFSGGLCLFSFYMTGLAFHVSSIFETAGESRELAFSIFFKGAFIAIFFRPVVGWLCDRIPLKYILVVLVIGLGTGGAGLSMLGLRWAVWLIVLGNAICGATFSSVSSVVWPAFYGREHLGAISGFNMALLVFASAIGPSLFSLVLSKTGTYSGAGTGCLVIAVILLIASHWANNPQEKQA